MQSYSERESGRRSEVRRILQGQFLSSLTVLKPHFWGAVPRSVSLSQCLKITPKVSNTILRAKQATFTLKMPTMVNFANFWKTWSLRSNSVTRQVILNRTKIGWKWDIFLRKKRDFLVIFKHCGCRQIVHKPKEFPSLRSGTWCKKSICRLMGLFDGHGNRGRELRWCFVWGAAAFQRSTLTNVASKRSDDFTPVHLLF